MSSRRNLSLLSPGIWLLLSVGSVLALAWKWTLERSQFEQTAVHDPALPSNMRDRIERIEAWTRQGAQAVPELQQMLRAGNLKQRRDAAETFLRLGPDSRAAADALAAGVTDDDSEVRQLAVLALSAAEPDAPRTLSLAAEHLVDTATEVRLCCGEILEKASFDAILAARREPHSPAVSQILSAELAKRTGIAATEDLRAIRELLRSESFDDLLRAEYFELLAWLDGVRLDDLLVAVQGDIETSMLALQFIEIIGPDGAQTAPDVARRLRTASPLAQILLLQALHQIGPKGNSVVPLVEEHLRSGQCFDPGGAARAIISLGGRPEPVAEFLHERLLKVVAAGESIASALAEIDPRLSLQAAAELKTLMQHEKATMPERLAALRSLGPHALPAVDYLVELMNRPDFEHRQRAIAVIAAIGPGGAPAVPALLLLLDEKERPVDQVVPVDQRGLAIAAVNALAAIGPAAEPALPSLLQLYASLGAAEGPDETQDRREVVLLNALGRIAPRDARVQEIFRQSRSADDPEIRATAILHDIAVGAELSDSIAAARTLLLQPITSPSRQALIKVLGKPAVADPETQQTLAALAGRDDFPLADRTAALAALADLGDKARPVEPQLRALEQFPPAPLPGPSRITFRGSTVGVWYKPLVRDRLILRKTLRNTLARITPEAVSAE